MNIKHQASLIAQIAAGVREHEEVRCCNLQVTFLVNNRGDDEGDEEYTFSLSAALDCLANDIYWDDRGNWADATIARVDTI